MPYVINTIAAIVADTIHERDEISKWPVSMNSNYKKYESSMGSYQIINYLNLIEHWNQLWSRLIGEEPFWYDSLDGKFNFESQMNYLLSYEDFPLQLNEKGCIDINKIEYFQNWLYILIAYLSASMIFLLTSIIVINRRDIT